MRVFKPLYAQLLIIFILLNIVWYSIIIFILPALNIHLPNLKSAFFLLQPSFLIAVFLISAYFIISKFNKKINIEIRNTNEIINRYEALSTATNDAIWDCNLITGETFYNNRLQKIFGYTKDDLKDNTKWWADNLHPQDKERVEEKINNILLNDITHWKDEYRFKCKDGSYKMVYDRSFIIRNEGGKPIRLIGAMIDITETKKLENELVRQQIENKNNLVKAIIQAHEEERQKIREELHEDVGQVIASVKLHINHINQHEQYNEVINQSICHLDDAMDKIRKISNHLAPPTLEYFGLLSAIADLIKEAETSLPLTTITLHGDLFDESKTNINTRNLIYRVMQDSLRCVFSQVNVTKVCISLSNNTDNITCLTIKFNGILSQNRVRERHLIQLRSKLEFYNGRMHISTKEDKENMVEIHL